MNFAHQVGVYILYDTINVVYVGRTVSERNGLYSRLKGHVYNPRRAHRWTHFSWFGLRVVDEENDVLGGSRGDLDCGKEIILMETLLIELLTPAFNDKGADNLGVRYDQVIDPVIHERKREQLRNDIKKILDGR